METTTNDTKQLSAIERALAVARARKAVREATDTGEKRPAASSTPNEVRDLKSAEKEAVKARRAAEREVRTAEREKRREEKRQKSRNADVHMKKVETARKKLPSLNEETRQLFERATSNFDKVQLEALALHLQFHNRLQSTIRAPSKPIPVGTEVRIVSGDHRYIGLTGTISRSQKLRSHVVVPGRSREVYTFTSDLEVVGTTP